MSDLFAIELKFAFCLFVNLPCFIISCMDKPSSSTKARTLDVQSGIITPNSAASVAGVLNAAETLVVFATRLLDAFLPKKYSQALAR